MSENALHEDIFDDDLPAEAEEAQNEEQNEEQNADAAEAEQQDEVSSEDKDEEGEHQVATVSELAEHLEVDPEWLLNLKVQGKVNGETTETTIQDLVNSYQTMEAAEHRLTEAKDRAKSIIQEATEEREQVKTELGTAAGLVMLAEQLFEQDLQNVDLAKLREEDREAYLIEKDRLTERRQALAAVKEKLGEQVKSYQQAPKVTQEDIEKCRSELVEALPHLEPVEARTKLAEYILTHGFSREDLAVTTDPRLFTFAEKARLYDESQTKTKAAKKKVVTIPKVMKPGSNQPAKPESQDAADILYS
jgi:hypothetical protein